MNMMHKHTKKIVHVAGHGGNYRYERGFRGVPLMRTSKCRCGPVEYPVQPTNPIPSPALTWPPVTSLRLMCAYSVVTPPPWSTIVQIPYPVPQDPPATVPSLAARIGVPVPARMSMP